MGCLAVAPFPQTPASADCAAPYLKSDGQRVLHRGATITIEGRSFVDGCQDSMSCSVGCGSCEYDEPSETPMSDVRLQLVQRDRTWDLGVTDAGDAADDHLGWVAWTFTMPHGARPGPARLVATHAEPVRIRVR
jgi:hypothetical protein